MSATTEVLLEEIRVTQEKINELTASGNQAAADYYSHVLKDLQEKLLRANNTLNEGKSLLKG